MVAHRHNTFESDYLSCVLLCFSIIMLNLLLVVKQISRIIEFNLIVKRKQSKYKRGKSIPLARIVPLQNKNCDYHIISYLKFVIEDLKEIHKQK